jgi:hypothetical protein
MGCFRSKTNFSSQPPTNFSSQPPTDYLRLPILDEESPSLPGLTEVLPADERTARHRWESDEERGPGSDQP